MILNCIWALFLISLGLVWIFIALAGVVVALDYGAQYIRKLIINWRNNHA